MTEHKPKPIFTYIGMYLSNAHTELSRAVLYAKGDEVNRLRGILEQVKDLMDSVSTKRSR